MTNFEMLIVGLILVLGGAVIAILTLLVRRVISIDSKLSSESSEEKSPASAPKVILPKKEKKPFIPALRPREKPDKAAEDKPADDLPPKEPKEKKPLFAFLNKKEKAPDTTAQIPGVPMPVIPPPVVSSPITPPAPVMKPEPVAPPEPMPVIPPPVVSAPAEPPEPMPVIPPPVISEPAAPPAPVFKEEPVITPPKPAVTAAEPEDTPPPPPKLPKKSFAPPSVPRIKTFYCSKCGAAFNEGQPCPNGCAPSRHD